MLLFCGYVVTVRVWRRIKRGDLRRMLR